MACKKFSSKYLLFNNTEDPDFHCEVSIFGRCLFHKQAHELKSGKLTVNKARIIKLEWWVETNS